MLNHIQDTVRTSGGLHLINRSMLGGITAAPAKNALIYSEPLYVADAKGIGVWCQLSSGYYRICLQPILPDIIAFGDSVDFTWDRGVATVDKNDAGWYTGEPWDALPERIQRLLDWRETKQRINLGAFFFWDFGDAGLPFTDVRFKVQILQASTSGFEWLSGVVKL